MPNVDWFSALVPPLVTFITGAGGAGLFFNRMAARKDRMREENSEVRKAVLKILPELRVAEKIYMRFLSESIYLLKIEEDLIATITAPTVPKNLTDLINASPLHLMKDPFPVLLTGHSTTLRLLSEDLKEQQSHLLYEFDHPEHIAKQAKSLLEQKLSDILQETNNMRRDLTVAYLGKRSWSKNDMKIKNDIIDLRNKAYSYKSLTEIYKNIARKQAIVRVRYQSKVDRLLRKIKKRFN